MGAIKKIPAAVHEPAARRARVLEGAMEVLAQHGPRGLTYRAIDRFLSAPEGTTTNYFDRRIDIVEAVAHRIFDADIERVRNAMLPDDVPRMTPKWVSEQLVALWDERPRSYVIARYQIMFEAAGNPTLQKIMAAHGVQLQEIWNEVFRRLGARDLRLTAYPWVDISRGLLLTQIMMPHRARPRDELVSLLHDQIKMLLKRTRGAA
jgi:AcrR family transcriptional regulator